MTEELAEFRQRGNAAYKRREYSEACKLYTCALEACAAAAGRQSSMHLLLGNRSAGRLQLGDAAGALADADSALALQPQWAKGQYRRAQALRALGAASDALEAARAAQALDPASAEASRLASELAAALRLDPGASPAGGEAPTSGRQGSAAPQSPAGRARPAGPGSSSTGAPPAGAIAPGGRKPPVAAALLPAALRGGPPQYLPSADGTDENLLVLLHGLGDRPAAFARLAQQMRLPQTAALALGGPLGVPFTDGGRAWFPSFEDDFEPIDGTAAGERRRLDGLAAAVEALLAALRTLRARCGWAARRVHLLGFSQGGTVALELARRCTGPDRLGSCVAISAALLPETLAQLSREQAQQSGANGAAERRVKQGGLVEPATRAGLADATPVLITRGDRDEAISAADVAATLRGLPAGSAAAHSVRGKAHGMPAGREEMQALMAFWAKHLSARPVGAAVPGRPPGSSDEGWVEVGAGSGAALERVT